MKRIKLTITENYVAHWSWWQGVRELIQNAVDTKDFSVSLDEVNRKIAIVSRGGKIPLNALLLGNTTKKDDDSKIGKFGEGMKLGLLVLSRLGADIYFNNAGDLWTPRMVYDETFEANCLAIDIESGVVHNQGDVIIEVSNIPPDALAEIKSKYAPFQDLEVVIGNSRGKAYKKPKGRPLRLFVNGIYVTEIKGRFKFDYDFIPSAFVLDRDRDSASTFEVKYEASRLLAGHADILLLAELASEDYEDLKDFSGKFKDYRTGRSSVNYREDKDEEETLETVASRIFCEKHGSDAFPINETWHSSKKRLVTSQAIKNGWVPVTVNEAVYQMVEGAYNIEDEIENMINFKPLEWMEKFKDKYGRKMYAKPRRHLEKAIEMLKIVEGK